MVLKGLRLLGGLLVVLSNLFLCFLVVLLHSVKQLLLLCLDHGGDFIKSQEKFFLAILQLEFDLIENVLSMSVLSRGFLMNKLSELLLQDLNLASETA